MNAARAAALISRPALAGTVFLVALGCAAPAQADHGRSGFHAFAFGFATPYPAPAVAYPAATYHYYPPAQYYYYPPPAAYYAPPAAYYAYAPPAGSYAPPAAYYPPPPAAYSPPPSAYSAPPGTENSPAANRVRPTTAKPPQVASGKDCHEAQHMITIDGRSVSAHGMLCRQPDGSYALSDPYDGSVASR